MKQKISIIGAQVDLGTSKRGVNMGPGAIRFAGLCEGIDKMGYDWDDLGDILPDPRIVKYGNNPENMHYIEAIVDLNKRLFTKVRKSLEDDSVPVVLGGDHSMAAGSIPAIAQKYQNIGVIWIDAHADFNNDQSTETGNVHGMPLSAICGWGPECLMDYGEYKHYVDPHKVVIVAGRDFDREEKERVKAAGINVFTIRDIDRYGMAAVMEKAIAILTDGTDGIHVSFDMDSISPQYAPGVVTPVLGGLTSREAFLATEMLHDTGKIVGIDMVEVNPILDEKNQTGELACDLILSLLGRRNY